VVPPPPPPSDCGVEGAVTVTDGSGDAGVENIDREGAEGERRKSGVRVVAGSESSGEEEDIVAVSSFPNNTSASASDSGVPADCGTGETGASSASLSRDFSSALRLSIHHTAPAESHAFVLTLCTI
jgi:hypothetical protein